MPNSPAKSTKRILIATPEFPPQQWGGLARTARNVAGHARDLALDVHVAHLSVDPRPTVLLDENRQSLSIDGVRVHQILVGKERISDSQRDLWDCPHTLTLQMMYQSLEKLHSDVGFDLFHSFFLYPVGYVTAMLARAVSVPNIVTIVGNDIKRYVFSPEKVAVCRSGLENADQVVGLSRDLVNMANALTLIAHKSRVVYNSVEIPEQVWSYNRAPGKPFRIGCAGIFKYAKGLPYLFKAVSQLSADGGINLELVGTVRDSEREMFDETLERTGIRDIVELKEPIAHEAVPAWLRTLDLFVLPSVTEGCPNILMEAMASGVPIVATRTGAVEDLVLDRVSGLLVPWGDSLALARAIYEVMEDGSLALSLGSAARARMADFSPQVERTAWETVYSELIEF